MDELAERIRAIAADPTPAMIAELGPISVKVGRLERSMDEIAEDARESENLPQRPPPRGRPRLTVVKT